MVVVAANIFKVGGIRNCVDDFLVLKRFGIAGLPAKPKSVVPIVWIPLAFGWIKLNIDGVTLGSLGLAPSGGVFRDHRGKVLASFSLPLRGSDCL